MTEIFDKDREINQQHLFNLFKDFLLDNYEKKDADRFVASLTTRFTDAQFLLLMMVIGFYDEYNDPEIKRVIMRRINEVLENG